MDAVAHQLSMLAIANAEQDLDKPPFPLYAYREILLIERRVLEMCVATGCVGHARVMRAWTLAQLGGARRSSSASRP